MRAVMELAPENQPLPECRLFVASCLERVDIELHFRINEGGKQ
jgi:hypothetical protein